MERIDGLVLTFVLIFRPTGILGQQLGDRA